MHTMLVAVALLAFAQGAGAPEKTAVMATVQKFVDRIDPGGGAAARRGRMANRCLGLGKELTGSAFAREGSGRLARRRVLVSSAASPGSARRPSGFRV